MIGNQVIQYNFEGKQYQIRILSDGATIYVRAFLNDKPAGFKHSVDVMTTALDLKKDTGLDAVSCLVESAKEDIKSKRWESLFGGS